MRLVVRLGVLAALACALATPALALPSDPDTLGFETKKSSGEIRITMIDDGRLAFELELERGHLSKLGVLVVDATGTLVRAPLDAGGGFGKVKFKSKKSAPRVEFKLKRFKAGKGKGKGKDKDSGLPPAITFFVEYEDIVPGDMVLFLLKGGGPKLTLKSTVVPEPGTLLLVSLGLGGLAHAARRRRR